MEGGVAALWCKTSVPSHIIQSKRGQGDGNRENGLNFELNQPQATRNIPDESLPSSHHPAAPAWLVVKGGLDDDKGTRDNIKGHSNDGKWQEQPIKEQVIERKTTTNNTLAVSLSSGSDEEDGSECLNDDDDDDDDEIIQNESCIEKTEEDSSFIRPPVFDGTVGDGGFSSDSEEPPLVSNHSYEKAAERCLWDTKYGGEGEGFNNTAAMALKEEKSQHRPLFNNKSKLRKLVKTRDKEDECDNRSDNTKRATALNAVLQEQQQERPKNNTTPKRKRLVKTTTKEKGTNVKENALKSYEKENEDELSESTDYDTLDASYANIQTAGGSGRRGENNEITAVASTLYCCNDDNPTTSTEKYFRKERSLKLGESVIVDLTSDGDEESDSTTNHHHQQQLHITPSQRIGGDQSNYYPIYDTTVEPSQAESIDDFSDDELKQDSGYKGKYGTYPNFKSVKQLCNCGGSNVDFNLMLKHQNGKVRTGSYEVRQRKRMAKKQQKKGKKPPRKSNAKFGKSGKRYNSAVSSRGLHNEDRGAMKRAHQWAPSDI